ncbi:SUKH-3 domain-containing protein [Paenibacillus sp. FSL L8-0470]|uniref:SUKH-3 domain-containing protein n=1 Tax=Paenibacillus sp. FSL L8-0470 TaxID=2954688 RepID=UPI0030FC088F
MREKISEITEQILSDAGWYPGRKVDIQEVVDFLESKGYKVFPCVLDVLYEFSKLRCSFTRPNGDEDSFYVNPEEAYGDYYDKEDFNEIEMRVKESLIAIGQARNDNMMMFMSESGKVYGESGYYLVKFGDNIHEALDNLCLVQPGKEIE